MPLYNRILKYNKDFISWKGFNNADNTFGKRNSKFEKEGFIIL